MLLPDQLSPTLRGGQLPADESVIYALTGELDAAAAESLVTRLASLISETSGPVVLDVSGVAFVDSNGLNTLLAVREVAARLDRVVALQGVSGQFERLLKLVELHEAFDARLYPPQSA